jgi:hypothetical protein
VNWASSSIVATSITTTIEATNVTTTIANLSIFIKTINATTVLIMKIRSQRAASPMKRNMIASVIISRKRATRPCAMTSPLSQVRTIFPEKGVALVQDLLPALVLGLALAQAAGATTKWCR